MSNNLEKGTPLKETKNDQAQKLGNISFFSRGHLNLYITLNSAMITSTEQTKKMKNSPMKKMGNYTTSDQRKHTRNVANENQMPILKNMKAVKSISINSSVMKENIYTIINKNKELLKSNFMKSLNGHNYLLIA